MIELSRASGIRNHFVRRNDDKTATNGRQALLDGGGLRATQRAREYFTGYRPSSPSIALMKDGEVAFMLERHQIEGRSAQEIAADLVTAFDANCGVSSGR